MHDKRLRDILPTAPSANEVVLPEPPPLPPSNPPGIPPVYTECEPTQSLDTIQNEFGMFRRYFSTKLPTHDPEVLIDLDMLSNLPKPPVRPSSSNEECDSALPLYPYPNENSFRLSEWFWDGLQKSHKSFKELLAIVGNPAFSPSDVSTANWDHINKQLGINDWDTGEWVDEDAGWHKSPVTIQVPFPKSTHSPGPRPYTVPEFYHRSLTDVIREKLGNSDQDPLFHYEPFELHYKRPESQHSIRLHGELYSSPAFLEAHLNLQNSAPEPECNLQRVVVGLMFWSDATHLTSFGKAKLWPLYLFFGNESKYRRCKPSENLCEHVAYFEAV